MSEDPCAKLHEEFAQAIADYELYEKRSRLPPTARELTGTEDIEPIIMTDELLQTLRENRGKAAMAHESMLSLAQQLQDCMKSNG